MASSIKIQPAMALTPGIVPNASVEVVAPTIVQSWRRFEGKIISEIRFVGLVRTRDAAARWMMQSKAGDPFNGLRLAQDIQSLFNTGVLYDIHANVLEDARHRLHINVFLKDKWTLFPIAGAQGGGGSVGYGMGLSDNNFFGTLVYTSLFISQTNGVLSFDSYAYTEYLLGSSWMTSIDFSSLANLLHTYSYENIDEGIYSWQRRQGEAMLGYHWPRLRLETFIDLFDDNILPTDPSLLAFNTHVFGGLQSRVHPRLIVDRVNITDDLQDGTELMLEPYAQWTWSQPTQGASGGRASFKQVLLLPRHAFFKRGNFAYHLAASAETPVPLPYQYDVGGFTNVRGFEDNRAHGIYEGNASAEYRPILFSFRLGLLDLDMVSVQGCVFSDVGSAWGPDNQTSPTLWSAGGGVRINFVKFAGAIGRLDIAQTLNPDEGVGVSFGVGQFF